MEQDPLQELDKNISGLVERLGAVEKNSNEYKAALAELQAKAGRVQNSFAPQQASLANEIGATLMEHKDELRDVKAEKPLFFDIKAAPGDMIVYPSGASNSITDYNPNIQYPPNRPYHIRELLPLTPTNKGQISYLKESSFDGNTNPTRMGSIKPQLDFNLTESISPVQTIAGWVRIAAQYLDDIPSMMSYLTVRLSENLLVTEDNQLLNGDGFTPNLSGILLAANHTAKTGSATIFLEKLVQAAGQIAAVNRQANGIVVNPSDFYAMLLNTASTSGLYSWPTVMQVSQNGQITILGIRVIWSSAIAAGNYLVGDFRTGAQMFIRTGIQIGVFYQDSTNVQQNMVTIRVEERIGLAVYNANAFVAAT